MSYNFIFPSILIVCFFLLYPIITSFILSFTNINLGSNSYEYVGLKNYISLLTKDDTFYKSLQATLIFVFSVVFLQIFIGMLMALVLNVTHKLTGIVKALLIIPWALPGTIVAGIWRFIYIPNYGLISVFLNTINLHKDINWLGPKLAMLSVIVAEVWRLSPFVALMVLAGLATIPRELYEAASVDGANSWQSFWKITLPMLKPILSIVIIMRILFVFQTMEVIYVLTKGGPGKVTYLISYYIYRLVFFNLRSGYGNALAYIGSFLAIIVCVIYISLTRERSKTLK